MKHGDLRRSDLVNGSTELLNDMEAVRNMRSIRGLLLDHFRVSEKNKCAGLRRILVRMQGAVVPTLI